MVKINNFEIIKETKILYEYINDILENAELDISKEELNDLLNVSNTLEKIYSDNYKKVEDKENLKTNCDCPKCQNKLIISDLINYNYLCEKCDENFYSIEVNDSKKWYLKSDRNEKLIKSFNLEVSYNLENKKMYIGTENSSGAKYICNDTDDVKDAIENYIYEYLNYNTYKLKIWETDEDRELGESFEYLESFNSVDDAINKAKRIISRNNYAFIEVIENETEELFFSTDGINEQYYREINSSMEL